MLLHMNITVLCSYLVVVSDVSENGAEVLDSEVDVVVHLFVHSVVRRIWVTVGSEIHKPKSKTVLSHHTHPYKQARSLPVLFFN